MTLELHLDGEEGRATRRQLLTLAGTSVVSLVLGSLITRRRRQSGYEAKKAQPVRKTAVYKHYYEIPVPKLGYQGIVKEPNLSNIVVAEWESDIGKIQRALRWRNITQAVEQRYGIPKDYLLGMICVESGGDPARPNDLGDGGVGLIHMQPLLTDKYGLRQITNSRRLRDFYQGRKIREALQVTGRDLKELISYDDRFHPIKNIDAAGRMLADSYVKHRNWRRALIEYGGTRKYYREVMRFVNLVQNPKFIAKVIEDFNGRNMGVAVESQPLTFDRYVDIFHQSNRNYGLDWYRKLPRYPIK